MNLCRRTDKAVHAALRCYQVRACGAAQEPRVTRRVASLAMQSNQPAMIAKEFAETDIIVSSKHTTFRCGRFREAGTRRLTAVAGATGSCSRAHFPPLCSGKPGAGNNSLIHQWCRSLEASAFKQTSVA